MRLDEAPQGFRVIIPVRPRQLARELFGDNAESFYYRFFEMKPHIIPAGVKALVFLTIGALGPYGSVYLLDWWRRHKIRRNLAFVTSSKD